MSTTTDLIRELHTRRVGLHAQMQAIVDQQEKHYTAEAQARFRELETEFSALGERRQELVEIAETAARQDLARKPFNAILGGSRSMQETELSSWLRHGGAEFFDVKLTGTEQHDLTKGGSAGATVPLGFEGAFYQHMIAEAGVRQTDAQVYRTSGGEPLKIPKSTADPTAAIVAEGSAITPNDPTFGSATLGAYGYKAMVYISTELAQDNDVQIEQIVGRLLGRAIGTANGVDLVTGAGSSTPEGVDNAATAGVTTTWAALIAGATGPDLLTDLYFSVVPRYRSRGTWLMADATLNALRKLKSTTNEYLVDRNLLMTGSPGTNETIFGRPVVTDPNVPTGAGAKDVILFGSFSDYLAIRDVGTVRLDRSLDFRFANDEIAVRAVLRTDSKQLLNGASGAVKALHDTA